MKSMSRFQDRWSLFSLRMQTMHTKRQPIETLITPHLKISGSQCLGNMCAGRECQVLTDRHRKEELNRIVQPAYLGNYFIIFRELTLYYILNKSKYFLLWTDIDVASSYLWTLKPLKNSDHSDKSIFLFLKFLFAETKLFLNLTKQYQTVLSQ